MKTFFLFKKIQQIYTVSLSAVYIYAKQIITRPIVGAMLFFILCFVSYSGVAEAATFTAVTTPRTVFQGETVTVDYTMNTQGAIINVLDSTITYPKELFTVAAINTGNSALLFWPTTPSVTSDGTIHFVGAVPTGISGTVPILSVTFRAIGPTGQGTILTANTTANVADGNGSALSIQPSAVEIPVVPLTSKRYTIVSATHPDPTQWYTNNNITITFPVFAGEEYSYSFSVNQEIVPDGIARSQIGELQYNNLPDGAYYFHLVSRVKNTSGAQSQWQEAGVYRVHIDRTQPVVLSAQISTDENTFKGKPFISLAATDKTSGVASYAVRSGVLDWYRATTVPTSIHRPIIGNTVYVKITDQSGNTTVATIPYRAYVQWWFVLILILLIIVFVRYNIVHKLFYAAHQRTPHI